MRSVVERSTVLLLLLVSSIVVRAQSTIPEQKGMVMMRITPALARTIETAFFAVRPANDPQFRHTDIHSVSLSNDSLIQALLGLSGQLHGLTLRPFIPTHSVAFEDIRERSNPDLFRKQAVTESTKTSNNDLRIAEDNVSRWFVLYFSDSITGDEAASIVRKSSAIESAEPKYIRSVCFTPNDPMVNMQYALTLIHAFEAWDVVRCDSTMLLADDDIGSDWTHEDLAAAVYQNPGEIGIDSNGLDKRANGVDDDGNGFIDDWHGWDFGGPNSTSEDNDPRPGVDQSHGTHTAGILAAVGNNNKGIAGVAFGAKFIPIKVSDNGGANLLFGFEGIIYAADMRAKVVNCSWGGPGRADAEQDVVNYAYAKDCAVVAAAGNNGNNYPYQDFFPAAYDHVLSVGNVDANGSVVGGSNYNTHVAVTAPGMYVQSTVNGNAYDNMSGTSMASPNAAGCVALVRQRFPSLTAGQAMQQVRATATPLVGVDSARIDFEGHGTVNAYKAVTDTNTYSARIEGITFANNNGTGSFGPGESGGIVLYVRNYLKPLHGLQARIEVVRGGGIITLHQSVVPFGPVETMGIVSNDQAAFQITVANEVPPNTVVLMKVLFFDTLAGYAPDYDYFSFVINPSYVDLNATNVTVTLTSKGSLGYQDVLVNKEGSGFRWKNAAPSISLYGRSVLYEGGLIVGRDAQHIVDVVEGNDTYVADSDFTPSVIAHYVEPDRPNVAQEISTVFSDSAADSAKQVGVRVNENGYAFTKGLAANAVVLKYILRSRPASTGLPPSDSTAAALFFDWDIGLSGSINETKFDSATQTAISYRLDPGYPYLGVKLLSAIPPKAALNYHAIMNDGSQGDITIYGPFVAQQKWLALNEFYPHAGPGDISHSFGLKNLPLASQDSVEMTVAIAMAESETLLLQTLNEVTSLWNGPAAVEHSTGDATTNLQVFPNPFQDLLHVSWNGAASFARIVVYDALGRAVFSEAPASNSYSLDLSGIPSGQYVIDVECGGLHLRRQIVSVH